MTRTFSKHYSRALTGLRKVLKIRADHGLLVAFSVCVLGGWAQAEPARQGWIIDTDAYATWQGRNDVQVPNDSSGSRFSLDGLTGGGPYVAPRVQLSRLTGDRREWRVLLAPLALSNDGSTASVIQFRGTTFASGMVNARYQFNSWRGTVRWRWIDREDLVVKIGITAKIRDASIRLRQNARSAEKDNTGFVPLLHGAFERPLGSGWRLEGDIDALAGGLGYAVDGGIKLMKPINDEWLVGASFRYLDGGADNDEVYAFASFTSAGISVRWHPRESGSR